ncbi:hypothetical protein BS78_05G259500 [Paspalum vaginatum]|nr:hypothetical protein BS78_05G259500 [Paspalum vaginatum]
MMPPASSSLLLDHTVVEAPGGTGRTTTTTGIVGPPPPSPPPSSVVDDSGCLWWCGDVHIPYPFGAGPAANCSASPDLRLHCNHTRNGVHKLFLSWQEQDCMGCNNTEVIDIDVIHGRMRVVSPIFYSCFINHNTTSEGRSLFYDDLPEPYRFSIARNQFTVLGCSTITYMLGDAFEGDVYDYQGWHWDMAACMADCSLPQPTNGSCTANVQGDEGLRYYSATFNNMVNETDFNTTYPCAYAVLMDSSYGLNFSTSYLAPNDGFNESRVLVVVDWEWVVPNQTCRASAQTQPTGYACVSDHSECIDSSGLRGYRCRCAEGFQGNPYVKITSASFGQKVPLTSSSSHVPVAGSISSETLVSNGPLGVIGLLVTVVVAYIDECKDNRKYPCYGKCNNIIGTYHCVCPEGTQGNAFIGECIRESFPFQVRLAIGISAGVLVVVIAFLVIKVLLHKKRMKRQALFQHNGGQLLTHMLKVEGNASFTVYSRGDIVIASHNFHKTKIVGEGAHGTVYKVTLDVGGRATAVAVKRCKAIDESRKEFVQELVILCHLSHPNIVKLVGCCLEFEAPMLVYEFVQNGNLNHLLHGSPRHHGWIAKVSDFGCSTIKDNVQVVPKGTLAYLDPQFLHTFQLTDKGDVYSFGVVLVELLTRKKPRPTSREEKNMAWIFQESIRQGTLHELLNKDIVFDESSMVVIKQVAELESRCLAVPSATRPSMEQVAQQLRHLKDQVVEVECPQEVEDDLSPIEMEMTTGYPTAQTLSTEAPRRTSTLSTE